jgi:hypothetical protein
MSPLLRALDRFWFQKAPPERPALLRLILGAYVLYYLGMRYRMLLKVAASDPALFKPVGVASVLEKPLSIRVFRGMLVATFIANVAFMLGIRHRYTGPLFAGLLLWVLSYRNSWSMIYHNDNVLVLHALVLGLTPSADALSFDALDRREPSAESDWRYGWPVKLMSTVTALTYFLAGVAKVAGPLGWRWGDGEALRAQVMVDGLRKELLGEEAAPLADALHDRLPLFKALGYGSLLMELGAPAALLDVRLSRLWALNAFAMHWGIYFIMKIKFRYQLSGLVFASFFDLDRVLARLERWGTGKDVR